MLIRPSPDCATIGRTACFGHGAGFSDQIIRLSDEEKLEILQRLDQFRLWHSLDEKRYCLVCSKIITGQEIQVIGGTRGNAPLRIICPTEHCNAIPMDWVRPTDEVLIKIAMVEAERRRNCLIIRAGHATRSLPKKTTSNTISGMRLKPPLG